MKASLLVKQLNEMIAIHGDLEVGTQNAEFMTYDQITAVIGKRVSDESDNPYECDDEELGKEFIAIV